MAVAQKYIVLLGERDGHQVWLAYDATGRVGNAAYGQAFRYDTWSHPAVRQAAEAIRCTAVRIVGVQVAAWGHRSFAGAGFIIADRLIRHISA